MTKRRDHDYILKRSEGGKIEYKLATEAEKDKHTIYVIGPYMKGLK